MSIVLSDSTLLANIVNTCEEETEKNYIINSVFKVFLGHEFRTPLTGILGCAELLDGKAGEFDAELKEMCNLMLISAQRMTRLYLRLGDWLRLRSDNGIGGKSFYFSDNWIKLVTREPALGYLKFDRVIHWQIRDIIGVELMGDMVLWRKAINEVVDNAFKFSSPESSVIVSVCDVGEKVVISIFNDSVYADAKMLNESRPFQQFGREKFEQQGLGVGLDIARMITKKNEGQLIFKSQPDTPRRIIAEFTLFKVFSVDSIRRC